MHDIVHIPSLDRGAVLERFIGGVSDDDAAVLRRLLAGSS